MTKLKKTSTLATVVLVGLLGACTTTSNGTTTPSATGSSSSPSATRTTTSPTPTLSPEEQAIVAAKAVVPEYMAVADRSLQEGTKFNVEDFKKVAISTGLIELQNRWNVFTGRKFTQTGNTSVQTIDNPRVDLKLDLTKSPPDVPTVQLDVCVDVSKVNLVDEAGTSQIPPSRAPRQQWRVGVSNYEYPKPDQWRVSFVDPQGGKTC